VTGEIAGEETATGETAREPTATGKITAESHDEISEFARHYNKPLYRHLLRQAEGDHALAEDLVQQVLEEVARKWPKFGVLDDSGRENLLFDMARKRAIDAFRKNNTARAYESRWPAAPGPAETDPFACAVTAETIARFTSVIESLPPRQARAATLRWLRGYKNVEIAKELGITRGAVTRLLGNARTMIMNEIGPYLSDEPRDPDGGA
jgi:RNA polymerase sigma factor (sigma-70 family)